MFTQRLYLYDRTTKAITFNLYRTTHVASIRKSIDARDTKRVALVLRVLIRHLFVTVIRIVVKMGSLKNIKDSMKVT